MAKIVVVQQIADPEAYRLGTILDAEFVPAGTLWEWDAWYSPSVENCERVFWTDEVAVVKSDTTPAQDAEDMAFARGYSEGYAQGEEDGYRSGWDAAEENYR